MIQLVNSILESMIVNMITPAVASTGELDETVKLLKRSIVRLVADRSRTSKQVLAHHFERSERWVYRLLEEVEAEELDREHSPTTRLIQDVMDVFYEAAPKGLSLEEATERLEAKRRSMPKDLEPYLKLYVDMDLLTPLPGTPKRFRAAGRFVEINEEQTSNRVERIGRCAEVVLPAALSYARGDDGARFARLETRLTPKAWADCVHDCGRFLRKRVSQAIEESLDEDPDEGSAQSQVIVFLSGNLD